MWFYQFFQTKWKNCSLGLACWQLLDITRSKPFSQQTLALNWKGRSKSFRFLSKGVSKKKTNTSLPDKETGVCAAKKAERAAKKARAQPIMYECNPCTFWQMLEAQPDTEQVCVPEWAKRQHVLHTSCRVALAEPYRLLNLCAWRAVWIAGDWLGHDVEPFHRNMHSGRKAALLSSTLLRPNGHLPFSTCPSDKP